MINDEYKKLLEKAEKEYEINRGFLMDLKKMRAKNLDREINALHDRAFEEIDCLQCGNCCRCLGPRFQEKDIKKLAKRFKMRPVAFEKKYLTVDEDEDWVFKEMPCPFIADDNYCLYYEDRPKACMDYPYTQKTRLRTFLKPTLENSLTCPAVYLIFKWLKEIVYS